MSKILCIDTATEACSVALLNGNQVTDRYQLAPREHANLTLPMVEELLAESSLTLQQLDAIACDVGPGAFTGIRIGVGIAQGLAFAADLPTIALSSLALLAIGGHSDNLQQRHWLCAIDARMDEVYFAAYRIDSAHQVELIGEEAVIHPSAIDWSNLSAQWPLGECGLVGSGWPVYAEQFYLASNRLDAGQWLADRFPRAKHGLALADKKLNQGQADAAETLQPVYLRNQVAEKSQK